MWHALACLRDCLDACPVRLPACGACLAHGACDNVCVWMGDNYSWLRSNSLDSETGTETLRVLTNSFPPQLVFSRDVENKGRGQC